MSQPGWISQTSAADRYRITLRRWLTWLPLGVGVSLLAAVVLSSLRLDAGPLLGDLMGGIVLGRVVGARSAPQWLAAVVLTFVATLIFELAAVAVAISFLRMGP